MPNRPGVTLAEVLAGIQDPHQLLQTFITNSPIGIQIYDSDGRSIYTNEMHTRLFGAPPPPGYCVLKDDIAAALGWLPLVHQAFQGKVSRLPSFWYDPRDLKNLPPEDLEYIKQNGKKCAIESDLIPVTDQKGAVTHVIFVFRDVTGEQFMKEERERAIKERDDANALVRSVLDRAQAVIYIKNLEGRYLLVNRRFCEIFDRTLEEIIGKSGADLFPPAIAETFRRNDLEVQGRQGPLEVEEVAIHSDGTSHTYLSLKFPLLDSMGTLYGTCGISSDITRRRRLETELEASRRKEAIGSLAGGVAHDFGNLLSIILLNCDLHIETQGTLAPDLLLRSLKEIRNAAMRGSRLTQQLLAFGRRRQTESCVFDLGSVIHATISLLGKALGEDIQFEIEVAPDTGSIEADPLHVEQILTNLCLNARDAMPKGGLLCVWTRNLTLSPDDAAWRIGKPKGEYVELAVSDTGMGMSPEIVKQAFEPFFTTKPTGQGTGLGLASVLGLVESNGGDIAVESVLGWGTVFRVCFPRAMSTTIKSPAAGESWKVSQGGTEIILLVEDQEALRKRSAEVLRTAGYQVIEARDGSEGLELWRQGSPAVDLIITDVIMPGLSGTEMIHLMESARPLARTRVLFVSGYSENKLSAHEWKQKSLHFLEKPYSAESLLRKIRYVLDVAEVS